MFFALRIPYFGGSRKPPGGLFFREKRNYFLAQIPNMGA